MNNISTGLDQCSATYDNLILIRDFNVVTLNLAKQKSRYKSPGNPSCRDLILTNCHRSFQNTFFLTGLSDFHKMTVSVLKSHFLKQKHNIVSYRTYKRFHNNSCRTELSNVFQIHKQTHSVHNHISNFRKQLTKE